MKCAINDKDLLLFAHGELSLVQGLRVAYHLSRCVTCRQRQARLLAASASFAGVIRGNGLPEWPGPAKRILPYGLGSALMAWPTAFVMVGVIVLAASAVFAYAASAARVSPAPATPIVDTCHESVAPTPTPTPRHCRTHLIPAKNNALPDNESLTHKKL